MKPRVHLVVSEEPVFHPVLVNGIIDALSPACDIVGITLAFGSTARTPFKKVLKRNLDMFGLPAFAVLAAQTCVLKLLEALGIAAGTPFSVRRVARRRGIPVLESRNVNERVHLDALAALRPDVIVSSCGHIFRKDILSIPAHGCINRHTSLLPAYGGLWPVFWAMLKGEKRLGQTIHTMTPEIDRGLILAQEEIVIDERSTLYGVYARAVRSAPALVAEAITVLLDGRGREMDSSRATYFRHPAREDGRAFRRQHRFFTLRELLKRVP